MRRRSKADREFISEAEEILEAMRGNVADLSDAVAGGADADPDLVNALFRSAHSLKALAGMFRFDPIETLAHRLEDVLDGLRLGRVALAAPLVASIDETVALFASLLEQTGDSEALAASAAQIEALGARIAESAAARAEPVAEFAGLDVDPLLLRALTEYEEHRLRESLRRGRHIALAVAGFDLAVFEERLAVLSAAVRESGEVISTLPTPGEAPESEIRFSLLVASDLAASDLAARLAFSGATVRSVAVGRTSAPGPAAPVENERASAPADASAGEPEAAASASAADASLKSLSSTVRVDISKLDDLMNLVGEIVIARAAIGDLISRLRDRRETARLGEEFAKVYKSLDRKLHELQSAVLDVRMVPLRQVFEKVSRVVRRLRRDLHKDVELEIRGSETELDKLIVEGLVDPLMQVIRNAIDHGIERPEERRTNGKDPVGRIAIDAFQRGSHVVISVRDDGRGIDTATLRRKAEERGLVEPGETLSEDETLDLIFAPGISTRDAVTEVSGRGVGMDVVRANLAALGGVVDVISEPGRGTTISMTLPITLAIVQSLIVGVRDQRFAIPLNSVLETLVIDPTAIQLSAGRELLNLRGEPLLLRRLAEEFRLDGDGAAARPFVIVIGIGDQRAGLVVDRLDGQQDTVIKPIQGPIRNLRGIAGATDLGDENPVLVLDVAALLEDAVRRKEAA